MFRDLFERQSFEDDGVFDWDIIKKQQQGQAGGESNVDLTAADIRAAGPDGAAAAAANNGNDAQMQNQAGGSMRQNAGATGGDRSTSQRVDGAGVSRAGAGMNEEGTNSRPDENGDMQNQGQRRSIISSIR